MIRGVDGPFLDRLVIEDWEIFGLGVLDGRQRFARLDGLGQLMSAIAESGIVGENRLRGRHGGGRGRGRGFWRCRYPLLGHVLAPGRASGGQFPFLLHYVLFKTVAYAAGCLIPSVEGL